MVKIGFLLKETYFRSLSQTSIRLKNEADSKSRKIESLKASWLINRVSKLVREGDIESQKAKQSLNQPSHDWSFLASI